METHTHVFLCEFCKIFKNTSGWLLLYLVRDNISKAIVKDIRKVCQPKVSNSDHSGGFDNIFYNLRMLECLLLIRIFANNSNSPGLIIDPSIGKCSLFLKRFKFILYLEKVLRKRRSAKI